MTGVRFQEVSGLKLERKVSALKKGGENEGIQYVPEELTHGNVVLKRALEPLEEGLSQWIKECMSLQGKIKTRNMVIFLMDMNRQAVACWFCSDTYPIKWEVSAFDAMKNEMAIESIEMAFHVLERKK